MLYVVANPEDLLEAPNGFMAPAGSRAFQSPTEAMNHLANSTSYWREDVYPCDAEESDCDISKDGLVLLYPKYVGQSNRINSWITVTNQQGGIAGAKIIAAATYGITLARIPFKVRFNDDNSMTLQCLVKDRNALNAIWKFVSDSEIKVSPVMEIVVKPVTIDSQFDNL